MRPAGSDAESDDVLAAVAAAVARDAAVQAELAAAAAQAQRQQYEQYASSESEGEEEATWPKRKAGPKAAKPAAAKPELHRFAGSSSEDEEGGDGAPAVIDFGGVDYEDWQQAAQPAQQQPAQKRAKKERAGANKGTGPSVRPGELVHAGTDVLAGAQAQLFAGSGGGGDGAGGAAGSGFAALGLSQQLAEHLSAHNFSQPTRVQQEAIPLLLAGKDALVNAPTGSGKTLWWVGVGVGWAGGGWGVSGWWWVTALM